MWQRAEGGTLAPQRKVVWLVLSCTVPTVSPARTPHPSRLNSLQDYNRNDRYRRPHSFVDTQVGTLIGQQPMRSSRVVLGDRTVRVTHADLSPAPNTTRAP